jgi:serine/threonine protein kinase/tetratricopeptide (TPR) repeat protein
MGQVWRGTVGAEGPTVAVKVLAHKAGEEAWARAAFRNEVRAVAGLDHPSIVAVLDQGVIDEAAAAQSDGALLAGSPYLVMPLIEGRPLQAFVGRLPWADLREVLLQLADALAHSHARGLIHRDLKPGNVLLATAPGDDQPLRPLRACITDFGLADSLEGEEGRDATVAGTPAYMAPEQIAGAWRDQGPGTDLYALGCLGWALATGQPPFGRGRSFAELRLDHQRRPPPAFLPRMPLPAGYLSWLCRTLQKQPQDRFLCAADAAAALLQLPDEAPAAPVHDSIPAPTHDLDTADRLGEAPLDLSTHITEGEAPAPGAPSDLPWPAASTPALPCPPPLTLSEERSTTAILPGVGLSLFGLRTIPLVGRSAERTALWSALLEVHRHRRPRALALRGPAGVGKARLAEWLMERAQESGAALALRARFSATDAPGSAMGEMIGHVTRSKGMTRSDLASRLVRLGLTAGGEDAALALAELVSPAGPEELASGGRVIRFAGARERIVVVERALRALAHEGRPDGLERPLLLWLDDPGATPEGLELVRYLLGESDLPLLVILTGAAPLPDEELAASGRLLRLDVGPLRPAAHRALVRHLAGLEADLVEQVVERTEGSPLFAVQLVTEWVARGALVPGAEGYRLAPGQPLQMPASLADLWGSRVEQTLRRFRPTEQCAIELAALIGARVRPEEWRAAARLAGYDPRPELVEHLLAVRLAYIEDDGPDWSFAHPMVRTALEARAAAQGRLTAHHRAIARSLRHGAGAGRVERIGRHLLGAGQLHAALGWLLDGAEERLASGDFHGTQRLLDLRDEALQQAQLDPADLQWAEGWLMRAGALRQARMLPEALLEAARALTQAQAHKARRPAAQALLHLGTTLHSLGMTSRSWRRLREAERLAQRLGDPTLAARANTELARILMERGRFGEAQARLRTAHAAFLDASDERGLADSHWLMGALAKQQGSLDQAAAHLATALSVFERIGARGGVARCTNELGEVARLSGALDEAEQHYREALRRMEELGAGDVAVVRFNLGLVLQDRGRALESEPLIADALARFHRSGHAALEGAAHIALLVCAATAGAWAHWDQHLAEGSQRLVQATFIDIDVAASAERAAALAMRAGQADRAESAIHLAVGQWSALGRAEAAQRAASLLLRA